MRRAPGPLLALPALTLACLGAGACGASAPAGSRTAPASATAPVVSSHGYLKKDGDIDPDDRGDERHGDAWIAFEGFPHRASATSARAVGALIKRYYAVAATDNGAQACSLLSSSLAATLAGAGAPGASARARCAKPMTQELEHLHAQLVADEVTSMVVTSVHIRGNLGIALLGFRKTPEREILVERDGGQWRIDALFDGGIS